VAFGFFWSFFPPVSGVGLVMGNEKPGTSELPDVI
jgi:hypothetical protein